MAAVSGGWKALDTFCGQIAANSLMHQRLEVLVGSVIYSNFHVDDLDGNSFSLNVSSICFAYFPLCLKRINCSKIICCNGEQSCLFGDGSKKRDLLPCRPCWTCLGRRWKCVDSINSTHDLTLLLVLCGALSSVMARIPGTRIPCTHLLLSTLGISLISTPSSKASEGTTGCLWLSRCQHMLCWFLRWSQECSFGSGPKRWWQLES